MLKKLKPRAALCRTFLLISLTISSVAISGCSTVPTDASCKAFSPITWSKNDTVPTQRQVIAHNKAYLAICPKPSLTAANYP